MLMRSFVSAAALVAATVTPAVAASDGALSTTASTGSVTITAAISDLVQISRLEDIRFDATSDVGDRVHSQNVCVFSNVPGGYRITAAGDSGHFRLSKGSDTLPYKVLWASEANANSGFELTSGSPHNVAGRAGCRTSGDSENATVFVKLSGNDLAVVPSGSYTGTLTLTVSPQ